MSSVTKNPMILQSATYIDSWFTTNIKNERVMGYFNSLSSVQSDKKVITSLKRTYANKQRYNNFEARYKELIGE